MGAEGHLRSFTFISVFKVLRVWKWFHLFGAKSLFSVVEKTPAHLSCRLSKGSVRTSTEKSPIPDDTVLCMWRDSCGSSVITVCLCIPKQSSPFNSAGCGPDEWLVSALFRAAWVMRLLVFSWEFHLLTWKTKLENIGLPREIEFVLLLV